MTEATNHNATIAAMLKSAQADQEKIAHQARTIERLEREIELARAAALSIKDKILMKKQWWQLYSGVLPLLQFKTLYPFSGCLWFL